MKTKFKYFAAAFAIVAAASCAKENVNVQEYPTVEAGKVFRSFTGISETTKGDLNGLVPTWIVGDSLKIFDNINPTVANKFFVTKVDGNNVTFEGPVSEGAQSFKAIYPYYAGANWTSDKEEKPIDQPDGDLLKLNVTGYQYISAGSTIDPAVLASVATSDGGNFVFKNVVSLIKFNISENNVKEVKFCAPKGALTVVASTGEVSSQASMGEVLVRPANGETYFATGDYCAAIAPCKTNGITIACKVGSGLRWKQDSTSVIDFSRNTVNKIGTVDNGKELIAKWMFGKLYSKTNSDNFKNTKTKEIGYGKNAGGKESYVYSEFAGSGKIRYYQSTKSECSRKVEDDPSSGASSKYSLSAGAAQKDDYWDFSIKKALPAGTKLHIWFKANTSSGPKNWKVKYSQDGEAWIEEGTPESIPTTGNFDKVIERTWTLTKAIDGSKYVSLFRLVATENKGWPRILSTPEDAGFDIAPYIEIVEE